MSRQLATALRCIVFDSAVLNCTLLYCTVFRYLDTVMQLDFHIAVRGSTVLYVTVLYRTVLCVVLLTNGWPCTVLLAETTTSALYGELCCAALHVLCTVLRCTYCTIMYCTVYCVALYTSCTVLSTVLLTNDWSCAVLYCTVL